MLHRNSMDAARAAAEHLAHGLGARLSVERWDGHDGQFWARGLSHPFLINVAPCGDTDQWRANFEDAPTELHRNGILVDIDKQFFGELLDRFKREFPKLV